MQTEMQIEEFVESPDTACPLHDQRVREADLLPLVELPTELVLGPVTPSFGWASQDVGPAGTMRESCPYCTGVPLQLMLRFKQVLRSHLFCPQCNRRFDAIRPDGRSALAFTGLSAD